jgi:hypothetical protein
MRLPVEFEFEMYGENEVRIPHFTGHVAGIIFQIRPSLRIFTTPIPAVLPPPTLLYSAKVNSESVSLAHFSSPKM